MTDEHKTKAQLIHETAALCQRVAELQDRLRLLDTAEAERKRTEEALQETDTALRKERVFASAVLDTVGALVVVLDREGRIVRFNKACENVTGYSFGEVRGKYLWELLLVPEEVEPVQAVFRSLRSGQFPSQYENDWVARDGKRRFIAWTNTALLDDAGSVEYVIGTGVDISERRRAEEALRESEGRYRRMFQAASVSLWEENITELRAALDSLRSQGVTDLGQYLDEHPDFVQEAARMIKVLDVNDITLQMHGAETKEQLLGALDRTLAPEALPTLKQEILAIAQGRPYFEKESYARTLQGERLDILVRIAIPQASAGADTMLVSIADITERVHAERALRESEERYRTLFETASDAVLFLEGDSTVACNEATVRMFGYEDKSDIVGRAPWDFSPATQPDGQDSKQKGMALVEAALNGHTQRFEWNHLKKDGTSLDTDISLNTLEIEGKSFVQAIVHDVTERVRAEKALQRRNRELALLNRAGRVLNATLNPEQVLAAVLEEMRTLLGVVACSIWLIEQGTNELVCRQASGPGNEVVRGWRLASGEGLVGWVAQSGESLIVPDAQVDERHFQEVDKQTGVTLRSILGVPLQVQQETIGVLLAMDTEPDRFDATDLRVLESLAASASAAIENARLHQETVRRLGEAEAIGAVASDLTRSLDVDQVLASIVDAATRLIPASTSGVLHLVDESGDSLIPRAARPPEVTTEWKLKLSVGEGIAGLVMQEKRTINVPDVKRDPRFLVTDNALHQAALLTAPLLLDKECIGTLSLNSDRTGAFSPDDERVLTTLAAQAAVAVRNARLHEQIRHHAQEMEQRVADRTQELAVLYEVAAIASQPLDLEMALTRSLETALAAMEGSEGLVHLLDEDERHLRLAVQQGLPPEIVAQVASLPSDRGLGKVIARQDPLVVHDIASDPRMHVALPIPPRAYVGVPMRASGQPVGVLSVLGEVTQLQLSMEGLSLLSSVADEVGMLVESARLRQRAERAAALEERARLARDLHDSVTQSLYSVILFAESGRELAKTGHMKHLVGCLDELSDTALQALREMRLLVYELRPSTLAQEGLVNALQQRLDAVEGRAGVEARLLVDGTVALSPGVEQELYRIAQEALNNALKHAKAMSVVVHIRAMDDRVQLEVTDNGQGFDPQAPDHAGGMGLRSMRERAEGVGGSFAVLSAPGEGTKIRVKVKARRDSGEDI